MIALDKRRRRRFKRTAGWLSEGFPGQRRYPASPPPAFNIEPKAHPGGAICNPHPPGPTKAMSSERSKREAKGYLLKDCAEGDLLTSRE